MKIHWGKVFGFLAKTIGPALVEKITKKKSDSDVSKS